MQSIVVTINGVSYTYRTGTLDIIERVNGRNTISLEVQSLTGAYRPTLDHEIIVTLSGTRIFGGIVEDYEETGIGGESAGVGLEYLISGPDFNSYADRLYINGVLAEGTLKSQLTTIIASGLDDFGVTMHGSQADGPTLGPTVSPYTIASELLNTLADLATEATGQAHVWEIDYNEVFRMYGVLDGSHAAPFNITEASAPSQIIGDVRVRPSRNDFANAVHVVYGEGQQNQIDSIGVGDGTTATFTLHLLPVVLPLTINVGGSIVGGVITGGTDEVLGTTWTYNSTTNTITRTSPPTLGQNILAQYDAQYPGMITVDDGGPASLRRERLFLRPAIFDVLQATAVANALLIKSNVELKEVEYDTHLDGVHPGQVQTIILPKHDVSGVHLITEVRVSDRKETVLNYTVRAVAGSDAVPESWTYLYELWTRGSTSSASSASGSVVVGGGTQIRNIAALGGSRNTSAQKTSPPSWVPAVDYFEFVCPTGVTSGLVRTEARAKDAGVSVTVRLYNVSDSSAAATAGAITTTTFAPVVFSATLVEGDHYRLEVLASETADVFAIGSIEYG